MKAAIMTLTPGHGERIAIGGYYPQYRIASALIIQRLREDSLVSIRLADPMAGRVDDLQIISQNRVDAYQVKWSQHRGMLSLKNLTESDNPSLIAQLADGWKRLNELHPNRRVVVHLLTNQVPSTSTNAWLPIASPQPTPKHLAAFIDQDWQRAHIQPEGTTIPRSIEWEPVWNVLQQASGLTDTEFEVFVRNCKLEFDYRLPFFDADVNRDMRQIQRDIEYLTQKLFEWVADPASIIELTRQDLLARLRWTARFEYRSVHFFPVDEALYVPIEPTVARLEQSLTSLSGGYIAVLGSPGSGKSTLLTQTLSYRSERIVRYYAYVPDAQRPNTLRGEVVNFLHDIVLAVDQAGFQVGNSPSMFDRDELVERLHKQLALLHQNWKETGVKTIFLIDGLDHIEREQHPQRSFLYDLPLPEEVPDGIYVVLGSQTDELDGLPSAVQYAIKQPDRRIEIEPLGREATFKLLEKAHLSISLSEEQLERIFQLSEGHPLAAIYLLRRISGLSKVVEIEAALDDTTPYRGTIEQHYHSYWRKIEQDTVLAQLLKRLAHVRRTIDLSWVETWAGMDSVDRLRRSAYYFFRFEDANNWNFYHNSFRLFLLEKAIELSPRGRNPARSQIYHNELAEICAQAASGSVWKWEELYHRARAEDHVKVIELAIPTWFRNQFLSFRPLDAIETDIEIALHSAAVVEDPIAVTRLILTAAEFAQRGSYMENISIAPLLLQLGHDHIAIDHVRDGNRLRGNAKAALEFSVELERVGLAVEARRIFDLAEPILTMSRPILLHRPDEEAEELLKTWAQAVIHFRSAEKALAFARRIQVEEDRFRRADPETATRNLQNRIIYNIGIELLDDRRWDDFDSLLNELDTAFETEDRMWSFWLHIHGCTSCFNANDIRRAQQFFQQALERFGHLNLGSEERIALATSAYQIIKDEQTANSLLSNVSEPVLQTDVFSANAGFSPFLSRFRYTRLLYALGDTRTPIDFVPDVEDPRHQGSVYFERQICLVARIWADAWREREISIPTLANQLRPILHFYHFPARETNDWTSWYAIKGAQAEFYTLLLDGVALYGSDALEMLRELFTGIWSAPDSKDFWQPDVKRQILLRFAELGSSREWIVNQLLSLENDMVNDQDVSGWTEQYHKQTKAWIALGRNDLASRTLQQLVKHNLGIGFRKDYQLSAWIRWLGWANQVEMQGVRQRIIWIAQSIVALQNSIEGSAIKDAAEELLKVTFKWNPRQAVRLFAWFSDQGVIWYIPTLEVLLQAALENSESSLLVARDFLYHFLLPVSSEPHAEIPKRLTERVKREQGAQETLNELKRLLSWLKIFGLPSGRPEWRLKIAEAAQSLGIDLGELDLDPAILEAEVDRATYSRLKLDNNSKGLSPTEVKRIATSVTQIQELFQHETSDSYFDWKPVVEQILDTINREDVFTLLDLFQESRRPSLILATLSKKLLEIGDTQNAWAVGKRALELSSQSGWSKYMDGGTRIAAFGALIAVDKKRGRTLAYETLAQDLSGESRYPYTVALNLHEIVPLFVDDLPIEELWIEIEQHIRVLFTGFSVDESQGPELDPTETEETAEQALIDLLMLHIDHPVLALLQASQSACVNLLIHRNYSLQEMVRAQLGIDEGKTESLLAVLDATSLRDPEAILGFKPEIISLCNSSNIAIRRNARHIARRLDPALAIPKVESRPVPKIYRLEFPGIVQSSGSLPSLLSTEQRHSALKENPFAVLQFFHDELEFLSGVTGIAIENLAHHLVQLVRELEVSVASTLDSDGRLDSNLAAVGLRLTYRRTHARLARRALCHLIAELVDSGLLKASSSHTPVDWVSQTFDPSLLALTPSERPSCIAALADSDEYRWFNDEWIQGIDEAIHQAAETFDDFIVLAEETTLRNLSWEMPTETRRDGLVPFKPAQLMICPRALCQSQS